MSSSLSFISWFGSSVCLSKTLSYGRCLALPLPGFGASSKGLLRNSHLSANGIAPIRWTLPLRPPSKAPLRVGLLGSNTRETPKLSNAIGWERKGLIYLAKSGVTLEPQCNPTHLFCNKGGFTRVQGQQNSKIKWSDWLRAKVWTQGVYTRVQMQGMRTKMVLMWPHFLTKSW